MVWPKIHHRGNCFVSVKMELLIIYIFITLIHTFAITIIYKQPTDIKL